LLRVLRRHRLRALGLRQSNVADVARRFDMDHYGAVGTPDALAYVMSLMHWLGCSLPGFLLRRPLHPPTGLVRWLSTFSVVDQVDNGQLLLEQLVLEEARIFAQALVIVQIEGDSLDQRSGDPSQDAARIVFDRLPVRDEDAV
jgi:hypothetical protein